MSTITTPTAATQTTGTTTTHVVDDLPTSTAPGASAGNLAGASVSSTPIPPPRASNHSGALKDTNGAPLLEPPETEFSADFLTALLQYFSTASEHGQLEAQKGTVLVNSNKAKAVRAEQQEKLEKWVKDCESAAKSRGIGKIFGWIAKGLALLGSVVALAATGGAAAPVVAVATIGLISSALSIIDGLTTELGGFEFSLSNGLSQLSTLVLTSLGASEENAQKWGKLIAGTLPAVLTLGVVYAVEPQLLTSAVTGIMELANASEEATKWLGMAVGIVASIGMAIAMAKLPSGPVDALGKLQSVLGSKVMSGMKTGVSLAQAGIGAAEGGFKIDSAFKQKEADKTLADKKDLDAFIARLNQIMEEAREEIQKLIEQIQDAALLISKIFNEHSETTRFINSKQARLTA